MVFRRESLLNQMPTFIFFCLGTFQSFSTKPFPPLSSWLITCENRHHHVESIHFTSSDGRALHPALAAVQTPGREYYILRDNGMQVGCEEEGVALVWRRLLGCDDLGRLDKNMSV